MLYKSIKFHSEEEHGHSTISEIGYSYEFIEDFQDPREECYYRLASFFTSKKPVEDNNIAMHTVENAVSPLSATKMISTLPGSDACNSPPPINNWGPKCFVKENHVIKLMVQIGVLLHTFIYKLHNQ